MRPPMTYCVRRPGCTAWATDLTLAEAEAEVVLANRIAPDHQIYKETTDEDDA